MVNVVFDCENALALGQFWSAALSRPLDIEPAPSEYFASLGLADPDQTTWMFLKVPEPRTAKNRCHVDLAVAPGGDPEDEIARLVGLGAKRGDDKDEWGHSWTIMQDPEGNEFCIGAA